MVSLNINSVTINPVCFCRRVQCGVQGRRMIPLLIESSVLQTKSSHCRGEWPGPGTRGLLTADGTTCNDRDSHIMYTHPHTCIHVGIDVNKAFHEHWNAVAKCHYLQSVLEFCVYLVRQQASVAGGRCYIAWLVTQQENWCQGQRNISCFHENCLFAIFEFCVCLAWWLFLWAG